MHINDTSILRFLMPGIRMGWIVVNDRHGAFEKVKLGLENIVGRNFWPNSTTQIALPDILSTPSPILEGMNVTSTDFMCSLIQTNMYIFEIRKSTQSLDQCLFSFQHFGKRDRTHSNNAPR